MDITPNESIVPVFLIEEEFIPADNVDLDQIAQSRESAIDKLKLLGLSEDEVRALFGL